MAMNTRDELFGRNQVTQRREDPPYQQGFRPVAEFQDQSQLISITNQQQVPRNAGYGDGYSNRNKPLNYHYQQNQVHGQSRSPYQVQHPTAYYQPSSYVSDNLRNPLLGGSSSNDQKSIVMQRNQSVGQPRGDRKMREREDRIRKEKEEMQQLQEQYPFGRSNRGGAGAPLKDRDGKVVSTRRPYSQVREVEQILHSSHSISNLKGDQQSYIYHPKQEKVSLNQSIDVTLMNHYNQGYNIAMSPQSKVVVPSKITNLETTEQKEERQRRQVEYQEILRQQMMEKKAKEEEIKRKRMEEEMKEERRIQEEIEREKALQAQEKIKREQSQNRYGFQDPMPKAMKVQHSPAQFSNKASDLSSIQGHSDFDNSFMKGESRRQLDFNTMQNTYKNQLPQVAVNPVNMQFFNHMEHNFAQQLSQLKNEMTLQQQQFETQLLQLRSEAQRNVDQRVRAEQELSRIKINSQRESQRPLTNENVTSQSVRRSMAGINNYEKLFFGNSSASLQNPGYPGLGMQVFGNSGPKFNGQFSNNTEFSSQGMGGNFEGSLSLKADSAFVPLVQMVPPLPQGNTFITEEKPLDLQEAKSLSQQQQQRSTNVSTNDTYEGDISLNQLETAIEEIKEMNLGENYKHTQKVLEQARTIHQKPVIPEYRGIQSEDDEISYLAQQFSQMSSQQTMQDHQDLKKEYLMRNIPLNPIEEQSNEHTFPSMGAQGSRLTGEEINANY